MTTQVSVAAVSASTTRFRRQTAIATASSAASSTGSSLMARKRLMVPVICPLVSRRPEPMALLAATNGLREVIAGTPNQSATITAQPATSSARAPGTVRQAQIEYSPRNGHTSGRPRAASTPSTKAARGRPEKWQSIAPRHSETIIGSDWALST